MAQATSSRSPCHRGAVSASMLTPASASRRSTGASAAPSQSGAAGASGSGRPSGRRNAIAPSPSTWTRKPSSCTARWCRRHSRTRLASAVSPPSAQWRMWWASQRRASQPGNRHWPSRAARARRRAGETVRVRRPTSSTPPSGPCRMVTVAASQAMRRAVSCPTRMPPSSASAACRPARGPGQPATRRTGRGVPAGTPPLPSAPPASRPFTPPSASPPATVQEVAAGRCVSAGTPGCSSVPPAPFAPPPSVVPAPFTPSPEGSAALDAASCASVSASTCSTTW